MEKNLNKIIENLNFGILNPSVMKFIIMFFGLIFYNGSMAHLDDGKDKQNTMTVGEKYFWWWDTKTVILVILLVGAAIYIVKANNAHNSQLQDLAAQNASWQEEAVRGGLVRGVQDGYTAGYSDGAHYAKHGGNNYPKINPNDMHDPESIGIISHCRFSDLKTSVPSVNLTESQMSHPYVPYPYDPKGIPRPDTFPSVLENFYTIEDLMVFLNDILKDFSNVDNFIISLF